MTRRSERNETAPKGAQAIGQVIGRSVRLGLAFGALAAMVLFFMSMRAGPIAAEQVSSDAARRIITVSGQGVVNVVPDIARITAGVTTKGASASAALRANSALMQDIIALLKRAGIDARDIQTANLAVHPRQQHFRDGRPPKVTGYQVTNQLRLRVRKIDQLGKILDDLVSAGANQIQGISFDVSNAGKLRDGARGAAIDDARRKAQLYAKAAGARLGDIISIIEQGSGSGPRPPMMARTMAARDVPVERGSKVLHVSVSASWALR